MKKEAVDHPSHYNTGKYEVIDVIEDWDLGFNTGNAVKYIARHSHKGEAIQDIDKAIWYLQRHKAVLLEKAEGEVTEGKQNKQGFWNRDFSDLKMTAW
jgi:hypothetical protein